MPKGYPNKPRPPLQERFEKYISMEPMTGCALWIGATNACGYGILRVDGKTVLAHRVAYELYVGPIPDGMDVCHKCDTPACCSQRDLFPGTHADNMQDCVKKGRSPVFSGEYRGEKNGNSKLTEEQVCEIREDPRSQSVIAAQHGITKTLVRQIKKRRI